MTNINLPEPLAAAAALLAKHPLLGGLPAGVAADLLRDASVLRAAAGQILFGEGDEARHYLLVERGQVEVMRYSYNGDERVFRVFEPGQLMAEAAMFMPHGRYPMQARARSDVQCWRLCRDRLHEACRRWPDLALKLLAGLSKAVYDQVNKVDWMTSSSAAERLANYLMGLVERQGSELTLPLNQRQLAAHLGIRAETLSRLLNDWQTQGYISGKRCQWVLHDRAFLADLSMTARRPF
ncbi:Crp/Fnr family transcriptional regulator [Achromobacter pestifer]|uniref:Anaerobic regulatory protein n=1 Tax=Achromobacter pestifer TaxID=1353889 RepID=A0A6S7BFN6_9BURK|nr:Crp/Fnr family transcriptional regulator [Achromobacter pestifer]CAB3712106.1 Anaerobic regulatory protein [Achromobacter pestifer]